MHNFTLSCIYNLCKFITAIADRSLEFWMNGRIIIVTDAKWKLILVILSIHKLYSCMGEVNNALIVATWYTARHTA